MELEHPLTRQMRLSEVGIEGQARLSGSSLTVRGGEGSLTEFVYLHRAGVERLSILPNRASEPFVHAALFRHAGTRRMAAGAWRASAQILRILALDTVPR